MALFNVPVAQSHGPGLGPSQLSKLEEWNPVDARAAVPLGIARPGIGAGSIGRGPGTEILITNLSIPQPVAVEDRNQTAGKPNAWHCWGSILRPHGCVAEPLGCSPVRWCMAQCHLIWQLALATPGVTLRSDSSISHFLVWTLVVPRPGPEGQISDPALSGPTLIQRPFVLTRPQVSLWRM